MSKGDPQAATPPVGSGRGGFHWATAVVVLAYLGALALMPHSGFWVADNGAKFIQLQQLLRSQYRNYAIDWPGQALDPTFRWSPLVEPFGHVVNNRLYAVFPPFFALLSSFPYQLLGYTGLYVLPLLAGLATLPTVWQLAGRLAAPANARSLAVLLAGLGTPLWFYSLTFWEHTLTTALSLWGTVLLVRHHQRPGRLAPAAIGACCGAATWFREDAAIFGVGLLVVLLLCSRSRSRDALLFVGAAALTWMPLGLFQWWALGHPLGHHMAPHSPLAGGLAAYWQGRWTVILNLLVKVHHTLWLSWLVSGFGLLAWAVNPRVPTHWFRRLVPILAGLAAAGAAAVGSGYLCSPSPMWWMVDANGLFAGATVLFLAFLRMRDTGPPAGLEKTDSTHWSVERIVWVLVSLWVVLYVLVAPARITRGIHWGCRYLLPVYPLLAVLAAGTIARWWQQAGRARLGRAAVALALGVTLAAQVYALYLLRCRKDFVRTLNTIVAQCPEEIVFVDTWFLPMDLAPNFFTKSVFAVQTQSDALDLAAHLRDAGYRRVLLIKLLRQPTDLRDDVLLLWDPPLNFSPLAIGVANLDE